MGAQMKDMVPLTGFGPIDRVEGANRRAPISRKAKAAIVVRLLLNEGADLPIEELPEDLQIQLTQQMGSMRSVDRETLGAVISEFAEELDSVGPVP